MPDRSAKIRCVGCSNIFSVAQAGGEVIEETSTVRGLKKNLLAELLTEDSGTAAVAVRNTALRNLTDHGDHLPTLPTGPARAKQKIVLDHEPLPVHRTRNAVATILLFVGGLAGYGFVRWYTDTVISLDATAARAGAKRAEKIKKLASPLPKLAIALPKPVPRQTIAEAQSALLASPVQSAPGSPPVLPRTQAPATQRIGDLVVGVATAQIGASQPGEEQHLTLTLRITNLSVEPMVYTSWAESSLRVVLKDQNGNYYNRIGAGILDKQTIDTTRTITDTLEFEKPLATATMFDLDLPLNDKSYQFRIGASLIERAPAQQVAKRAAQVPTSTSAYDPEKDPQLIEDVKTVYRTAMERAEARALGMSTNNAARFRTKEQERVIKGLAAKLNLTVDQIKGMLASR